MKELKVCLHTLLGTGCDSGISDDCPEFQILISSP